MPTLLEIAQLYESQTLRARVLGAVLKQIGVVQAEPEESRVSPDAARQVKRKHLALTASVSAHMVRDRFWPYVLANPTIQTLGESCTDSDIEYVVAQHWNDVAQTV